MTSFEEGRDNFFCLTCLLFNIGNTTLRSYFKNTWPKVNGTGVAWCDKPEDGARFLTLVTGLKLANHEKAVVQNGDTNEWDLTLLVKLLMHSKFGPPSTGFVLPKSQEYDWLDEIREIRNTLIGHAKETMLPKAEFSLAWKETSDILEKFGATKEEIAAVLNDIEGTRKDAQEYRQRLLEAEERERKVVEHLKTVDERLVNIEKNQSEIYEEIIQKRQEGKSVSEEVQGTAAAAQRVVHWNISVRAEAGSKVVISDIETALAQKKKEIFAGVPDEDMYSEVYYHDNNKKQPNEVVEDTYEELGESYDVAKPPTMQQTDVAGKQKLQESDGDDLYEEGDDIYEAADDTKAADDSDSSDDEYESGAEYRPITQLNHETYCATKSARAKKKDLAYDELLPSYKKTYLSGEWKAEPLSEVVTSKVEGINQEEWSAEKLFSNPDEYLNRMASSGGETKAKVEQKFLQEILPSLEGECKKSDHHSDEIYQILAKLSCCEHSQSTVKHSLYLLRHLLTKDKLELSNARTIWRLEKILRGSFAGKEGLFNLESSAAQRLRLTVYSKVLCLLAICRCKGFLTFRSTDLEEREDAKVLLQNLSKCFCDKSYKKKDRLQLVAELTLTCLKWIFTDKKPIAQLKEALECFKKHLFEFDSCSEKELSSMAKSLHGYGWFCLQVLLCCVEHEVRSDPNALELLLKIVDWVTSKKIPDWKFFTAVSGMLTNTTMTNRNKDIRIKAGWKLVEYYVGAKKIKKTPEVAEAIEKKMSRVLFSPDPPVRTALAREFFADSRENISVEQIMNYLCWFYRNQALERKKIIRETKSKVVYLGSFQGEKVAIKSMRPSMQDLVSSASEEIRKVKSALITEAYFLRRLNEATRHPNIIHLLCCNTVRIPYHLITEYLIRGNLLKYLRQDCRSESPLRELGQLSQWCIEILDALVFLSKYKIVHRRIMAKSVFVGEDEVCKLSGFSAAEQESDVYMYCSREAQLDSPGIVRWLAPEVLLEGHYSKASDAWAFGVLMYEVFSLGCDPFRPGHDGRPLDDDRKVVDLVILGNHLPKLPCFDTKLYELMTTCWKIKPSARNRVEQLRGDLVKLQLEFMKTDAQFPERPPPVFPEVQPSNQEEALRKNKELRDYIKSKRKKKPSVADSSDYHQIAIKLPRRVDRDCPPPPKHAPKHIPKQNKPLPKINSPLWLPSVLNKEFQEFLLAHHPSKSYIKRIKKACRLATATASYWSKDSERPTFMFPKGCELAVYREADTDWWEGQCLKTGAFGHILKSHLTILDEEVTVMEETIRMTDRTHLKNLQNQLLDGEKNFVKIILIESFGADRIRMVSQLGVKGNLKDLAVPEKCPTYLCQVADALEFLHDKHIIHCDVQASNVFLLSSDVVQLGQLGRSRQLTVPSGETSSATCTIKQEMPEELLQWSPPEVIQSGSYSHASDVWSFGIFGWEICSSRFPSSEVSEVYEMPKWCFAPFYFLVEKFEAEKRSSALLTYLKRGKRLNQPPGCPNWLFLLLAVCMKYFPGDRPSMNTIHQHVTNRKPIVPVSEEKDHTALLKEVWDDIDTPFTRPRCSNLVNAKDRPTQKPHKALERKYSGKAASEESLYESFPTRSTVRLQLPPPPPPLSVRCLRLPPPGHTLGRKVLNGQGTDDPHSLVAPNSAKSGDEEIYLDSNSIDVSEAKKDFNSTKPCHGSGGEDQDIYVSSFCDLSSNEGDLYSAELSHSTGGNDEVIYADSVSRNLFSNKEDLKSLPSEADNQEIYEESGDSTLPSNGQGNKEDPYAPLETSETSHYTNLCKETIIPRKSGEIVKEVSASASVECLNDDKDSVTEATGSNGAIGASSDTIGVSSDSTVLSSGTSSDATGVSSGTSSDATGLSSEATFDAIGASSDTIGVSSDSTVLSSGTSSDATGEPSVSIF